MSAVDKLTPAQLKALTPEQIAAYQAATASGEVPTVSVAGLLVPAPLVPRIVASMRGLYPSVTADLDDEAAVRATLKYWVTTTLSSWEARQVVGDTQQQMDNLQEQAKNRSAVALQKAMEDAASIVEAVEAALPPTPDPSPTDSGSPS